MAEGLAAQGASIAIWGTNPAKNDAAVEQLSGVRGRRPRRRLRRRRPGRRRRLDGRDDRRARPGRLVLRQRRRRRRGPELPRDDRRRVAPRAAGQPRRRVLHRPGGDPAHGRPLRGRRHRRWIARVHDVGFGVLRPAEGPALRRVEGRDHRHDAGHRRRARPPRHPRQRRPPGLDRERHDGRRADVGQVRRAQPAPASRCVAGATAADFAGIAAYLAGPASKYTTGDVITIDGGYHSF